MINQDKAETVAAEAVAKAIAVYFKQLDDVGMLWPKVIPGGRYVAVYRAGFNWRIVIGTLFDTWELRDAWCYPGMGRAKAALDAWDGNGEPTGWFKHPGTNRCRPGCDPAKESIGWPIGMDPYEGVR
jgi:hypothetical protein